MEILIKDADITWEMVCQLCKITIESFQESDKIQYIITNHRKGSKWVGNYNPKVMESVLLNWKTSHPKMTIEDYVVHEYIAYTKLEDIFGKIKIKNI